MGQRIWTASQTEAIAATEKDLILSAAAGSGKTATLTERIIRLLKDPDGDADLSRMLIVTFTVAAAGELRSRIGDALNEAIAANPSSQRLTRQLAALEGARISTIDSFFKAELKPYFSTLGLPPDFSMLDEAEAQILKKDAMEETVAYFFENGTDAQREDFRLLADCLSNARSEGDLCQVLTSLADSFLSHDISSERLRQGALDLENTGDD